MMALSGVRSSCDMLARNSDLARLAASARSVSRMYFLLRSTSSLGALLLGAARQAEVVDRRHQPPLAVDQLLLVLLDLGDVGADRDGAAVARLQLVDLQPAPVGELPLEGGAAARAVGIGEPALRDEGHHAALRSSSRGVPGIDVAVRQAVVLLVLASCTSPAGRRRPTARRIRRCSRSRSSAACRRLPSAAPDAAAR